MKKPQKFITTIISTMIGIYLEDPTDFNDNRDEIVFNFTIEMANPENKHIGEDYSTVNSIIILPTNDIVNTMVKVHNSLLGTDKINFSYTGREFLHFTHHILAGHAKNTGLKRNRFSHVNGYLDLIEEFKIIIDRIKQKRFFVCIYPYQGEHGCSILIDMNEEVGTKGEKYYQLYLNNGGIKHRGSLHPYKNVDSWMRRNHFLSKH